MTTTATTTHTPETLKALGKQEIARLLHTNLGMAWKVAKLTRKEDAIGMLLGKATKPTTKALHKTTAAEFAEEHGISVSTARRVLAKQATSTEKLTSDAFKGALEYASPVPFTYNRKAAK